MTLLTHVTDRPKHMKTVLAIILLAIAPTAVAQQGAVVYEETVKFQLDLPPEMQNAPIPREITGRKQLLFDGGVSLMKNLPSDEPAVEEGESGQGVFRIRMMGNRQDEEIYTDYDQGTRIEQRDFLGRKFLVSGEAPEPVWRLTDEQSEFLGYACRKALTTRDSLEVEAWFTPEIPVPAGPGQYGGLPGLILVLTQEDGQRSFVAKEVTLGEVTGLEPPGEGKKVTRAEFDKIVDEKMKEMGAERGPGGGIRIRIEN